MHRREFLQGVAMLGIAQALPRVAMCDDRAPWRIGFNGVQEDQAPLEMQLRGRIPEACHGTLYRNGPALYTRGGERYQHWFDPDGMVQALRFSSTGVTHRGRFVRTRRFVDESAAGRFLHGGAGTLFPDQLPARNNETTNVANINVQPLNGELLALWEAGSAYRIDPLTLETLGQREWSDALAGAPFSAHPRFDTQGDLWNIGSVPFAASPKMVLYHISRDGRLLKSRIHQLDFPGYMHDFVLTPRHVIALNSSAVLGAGDTFVDRMHWEPDRASQLLVFDRDDFSLLATIEVPATFVFHFGNAWEERGDVHFTACEYPDLQIVSNGMRRLAQQKPPPYHPHATLVRYSLSVARQSVRKASLDAELEFPGFDRRQPFAAQPVLGAGGQATSASGLASAVMLVDPRDGTHSSFDYGDGVVVEEPLYVGVDSATPGSGYVVHGFLDYARERSGVSILRADNLPDGPIAQASMDRVMPLGFHGCFLPERV